MEDQSINPQGGTPNPFMGNNIDDNSFRVPTREEGPVISHENPALENKPEPKIEKPGERPSIFKGDYNTTRSKYLSFILGKKDGYKDFHSYGLTSTVRQKMVDLRNKIIPKDQEYVKKYNLQIEVNKMKRELGYKSGDDHAATAGLLKEIEDKTGIK